MIKKLFSLAMLLFVAASCINDLDVTSSLKTHDAEAPVFYATIENGGTPLTKVYADENLQVLWNRKDSISIFNMTTGNQQFRFTGSDGANAGGFNLVSGEASDTPIDHIYALYPYRKSTTITQEGVISLTLPSSQKYKENSFGQDANTMLSVTDGNQLMFRNVCGYLRFNFYGSGVNIKSITIRGNNDEPLAGAATVTMPLNGLPTVQMAPNATKAITLTCETPVAIGSSSNNPTAFYFVIPPTTFTKGISVTVLDDNDGIYEIHSNQSFSITRSYLTKLGAKQVTPVRNYVAFEDDNFKNYCVTNFDTNQDGKVSYAEALAVKTINVNTDNISSLGGIEHFTNLTRLVCKGTRTYNSQTHDYDCSGQLTSVDLSGNPSLTSVSLDANKLTSLNVSKNVSLTYLACAYNQLTSLDVSQNTALLSLHCYNNRLTSLNVTNNTALNMLQCSDNQLTGLDVSKNAALELLSCGYNLLSSLNVSSNTALTELRCNNNQLSVLDVSKNTELTVLRCFNNPITILDVQNNMKLNTLDCYSYPTNTFEEIWLTVGQEIETFNYNYGVKLKYFGDDTPLVFTNAAFKDWCVSQYDDNHDGEISLAEAIGVTIMDVNTDNITSLADIGLFTNLQYLTCKGSQEFDFNLLQWTSLGQLTSLDVSANTKLKSLTCDNNQLTSLKVCENTALTYLSCSNNKLSSLDISKNTELTDLSCDDNLLKTLDVSKNSELQYLSCQGNLLTSLNLTDNLQLRSFSCSHNQLTALDLSKNTELYWLNCNENQLTALDLSKNTKLTDLTCWTNNLNSLIIDKCTLLNNLQCYENPLTSLDVSKNTELTLLYCNDTLLTELDVSNNLSLDALSCYSCPQLTDIWLKSGQVISDLFQYDEDVATIHYK